MTLCLPSMALCIGIVTAACAVVSNPPRIPPEELTGVDRDLWRAALERFQHERKLRTNEVQIADESIPAERIRLYLEPAQRNDVVFEHLLERNESQVRFPRTFRVQPYEWLDMNRYRNSRDWRDQDRVRSRRRLWWVSVSLPAVSDDGMRGLVYTEAVGGTEGGRGAGYILERVNGVWTVTGLFALWVT